VAHIEPPTAAEMGSTDDRGCAANDSSAGGIFIGFAGPGCVDFSGWSAPLSHLSVESSSDDLIIGTLPTAPRSSSRMEVQARGVSHPQSNRDVSSEKSVAEKVRDNGNENNKINGAS
jgi:hypothetical protein